MSDGELLEFMLSLKAMHQKELGVKLAILDDLHYTLSQEVLQTYKIIWSTQPFLNPGTIEEVDARIKLDADLEEFWTPSTIKR